MLSKLMEARLVSAPKECALRKAVNLPQKVVAGPPLEVFKAWSNMVQWKMSLPMVGGGTR